MAKMENWGKLIINGKEVSKTDTRRTNTPPIVKEQEKRKEEEQAANIANATAFKTAAKANVGRARVGTANLLLGQTGNEAEDTSALNMLLTGGKAGVTQVYNSGEQNALTKYLQGKKTTAERIARQYGGTTMSSLLSKYGNE